MKALFGPYCTAAFLNDNGTPTVTLEATLRSQEANAFDVALASLPDPLDHEVDPYSGCTILHRLVLLEEVKRLQHLTSLLPRSSSFISARDARGRTCAHYAILQDSPAALEFLTEAGIDLDLRDVEKRTVFELAQSFDRFVMCVYLVAKGAKLPAQQNIRNEGLHTAVESGHLAAIERFHQAGLDLQTRHPVTKMTALQRAENLFEDAAQEATDTLWRAADPMIMRSAEAFSKARASDAEVVKRQMVIDYLKQVQSRRLKPATQPTPATPATCDLGRVTARLALLDDENVLTAADILPPARPAVALKSPSSDSLPPSYADATHGDAKPEYRRALSNGSGSGSLHVVNDLGPGLVFVLVVFAMLAAFIAWLLAR